MGFGHGKQAKLYVGGWNLSAYLTKVGSAGKSDVAEVAPLGTTDKLFLNGMVEGSMTGDGYYVDGPNEVASVMGSAFSAGTVFLSHLPQGDAVGFMCKCMEATTASFNIDTDTSDVGKVTFEATSRVGLDKGVILANLTSRAASGTTTEVMDVPVASNSGADGYLHIINRGTSLTNMKIQHSQDNSTYADLILFADATGHRQVQRVSSLIAQPNGLVNKYLKFSWTQTGTTQFFVSVARLNALH